MRLPLRPRTVAARNVIAEDPRSGGHSSAWPLSLRTWRRVTSTSKRGGGSSVTASALPAFPTTTIGSFPQTAEVRKARAAHVKGTLSDAALRRLPARRRRARAIRWQEEIGLDVLVHGEFERNDMVEYFGEQLAGFAFTKHGWVQSYGSRCVKPPIIFGDVSRPQPMTVDWCALRPVAHRRGR